MASAKRPVRPGHDVHQVDVLALAGFWHDRVYIKTGETVRMTKAEADGLRALNMARILKPNEKVPTNG